MKTVTKIDVARQTAKLVHEKIDITQKIVDGLFMALQEIMLDSGDGVHIEIRDFGVFEVKKTNPKPQARNPKTGEHISVPARKKVHFKAGKLLKQILKKPLIE